MSLFYGTVLSLDSDQTFSGKHMTKIDPRRICLHYSSISRSTTAKEQQKNQNPSTKRINMIKMQTISMFPATK